MSTQRDRETVLAILPGEHEHERVAVVLHAGAAGGRLTLQHQSWGAGIGWYNQKTLELDPQQVSQLRTTLGVMPQTRAATRSLAQMREPYPRLARVESA